MHHSYISPPNLPPTHATGSRAPAELKKSLDKAVKQYEKEKAKKKGSLELRAVAVEAVQRALQEVTVGCVFVLHLLGDARSGEEEREGVSKYLFVVAY
jgi:hypothetical protein